MTAEEKQQQREQRQKARQERRDAMSWIEPDNTRQKDPHTQDIAARRAARNAPPGDPSIDFLREMFAQQRMDNPRTRRDPHGIPINPNAPQGLDWIAAHGPDSAGSQRSRQLMQDEEAALRDQRLQAGQEAVAQVKQQQQPQPQQADLYGRHVAYNPQGQPVGFSVPQGAPAFPVKDIFNFPDEKAQINAGQANNAERSALGSQIEQVAGGFQPATIAEREMRKRSIAAGQQAAGQTAIPLNNPMVNAGQDWPQFGGGEAGTSWLQKPNLAAQGASPVASRAVPAPVNNASAMSGINAAAQGVADWATQPEVLQQGIVPAAWNWWLNNGLPQSEGLVDQIFGPGSSRIPQQASQGFVNWLRGLMPSGT